MVPTYIITGHKTHLGVTDAVYFGYHIFPFQETIFASFAILKKIPCLLFSNVLGESNSAITPLSRTIILKLMKMLLT